MTCGVLAYGLLPYLAAHAPGRIVTVSDIRPEIGRAFTGKLSEPNLSDDEHPTTTRVSVVLVKRGTFLHHLRPYLGNILVFEWLLALSDANYQNARHEVTQTLGPPHAQHADIRTAGDGRYSIWKGYIYFSLPPGTSIESGDRVEVVVPTFPSLTSPEFIQQARSLIGAITLIAAACIVLIAIGALLSRWAITRSLLENVVPGTLIVIVLLLLLGGGGEIYMRSAGMFPKSRATWPSGFDPTMGWRFDPGGEVRWTNGLSYWTVSRANSLGFLDHEPRVPKPKGTFRILLIGDSFVQGAEVPLEKRIPTIMAKELARALPDRPTDVVALGYSGTGQSNQLPYYEQIGRKLEPDLVVLVFVSNDFANNSSILEGVRNGWGPDNPPRLFFRSGPNGECSRIPIDANWQQHVIPKSSYLDRIAYLRNASPDYKAKLEDWNPTEDEARNMDFAFFAPEKLPLVFEDAVRSTKCSFAAWKSDLERDRVPFVVALAENVHAYRPPTENGQLIRVAKQLNELGIAWLDLYPEFAKRGKVDNAKLKFDGHWSAVGHAWAAESIVDYLKRGGYLTPPGSSTPKTH
jgi:lysophospholipase L1-like esterase